MTDDMEKMAAMKAIEERWFQANKDRADLEGAKARLTPAYRMLKAWTLDESNRGTKSSEILYAEAYVMSLFVGATLRMFLNAAENSGCHPTINERSLITSFLSMLDNYLRQVMVYHGDQLATVSKEDAFKFYLRKN